MGVGEQGLPIAPIIASFAAGLAARELLIRSVTISLDLSRHGSIFIGSYDQGTARAEDLTIHRGHTSVLYAVRHLQILLCVWTEEVYPRYPDKNTRGQPQQDCSVICSDPMSP